MEAQSQDGAGPAEVPNDPGWVARKFNKTIYI